MLSYRKSKQIVLLVFIIAAPLLSSITRTSPGDELVAHNSSPPPSSMQQLQDDYPIFYVSRFDPVKEDYGWWVEFTFTAYSTDIERDDAVTVTVLINNEDEIWSGTAAHFDEEYVYARIPQTAIVEDGLEQSINVTCIDFLGRSKSVYQVAKFDVYAPRTLKIVVSDEWQAQETVYDPNNMIALNWRSSVKIQYSFADANFDITQCYIRQSFDEPWEKYGTNNPEGNGTIEVVKEWVAISQQVYEATWYIKVVAYDRAQNLNENEFILFFSIPMDERPIYNQQDLDDAAQEGKTDGRKDLWFSLLAIPLFAIVLLSFLVMGVFVARKANYCPVIKSGLVNEMKILD